MTHQDQYLEDTMRRYDNEADFAVKFAELDAEQEIWEGIVADAPSQEELAASEVDIQEAEALLKSARDEYRRKAVERGAAIGWRDAADEIGVSTWKLRSWQRELIPDIEDRSAARLRNLEKREFWTRRYNEYQESLIPDPL